jgi:acid phosphatase type 7
VSFAIIGDFGVYDTEALQIARLVDQANLPMLITVGDNAYPDGSQIAVDYHWLRGYRKANAKAMLFPTWGNHDNETVGRNIFSPPGNGSYYSFEAGDIHFTVLDSNRILSAAQKTWLATDLAATRRKWKLVFLHHAPYSCGTLAGNDLNVRNQWGPLFEKYKVDVVFAGHEHTYSRTGPIDDFNTSGGPGPDGLSTIYIVEGASGSGGGLASSCPTVVAKSGRASYVVVNISGGTLRLKAIGSDGAVLDTMTLTH